MIRSVRNIPGTQFVKTFIFSIISKSPHHMFYIFREIHQKHCTREISTEIWGGYHNGNSVISRCHSTLAQFVLALKQDGDMNREMLHLLSMRCLYTLNYRSHPLRKRVSLAKTVLHTLVSTSSFNENIHFIFLHMWA